MAATTLALAASASGAGAATITSPIAAAGGTDIADLFAWARFETDFEAVVTLAFGASPSIASAGFLSEVDVKGVLASRQIKHTGGTVRPTSPRRAMGRGPFPFRIFTSHWR